MPETPNKKNAPLHEERWELLEQINQTTEKPLIALSFVWLILLIIDLTAGLGDFLQWVSYAIWALFVVDFLVEIIIAPDHVAYFRRNWLTAVALLLPALRILRIFRAFRLLRAARSLRSVNLVRVVTSVNRGMRAVSRTIGRRGIGYVVALTLVILFGGAAGMYYFEGPPATALEGPDAATGFSSFADALWWTAMLMTTLGSDYWPVTAEGRLLTLLLSLYAFAVFGYIAGTIASFFVGPGAAEPDGLAEGADALREEIAALRTQLAAFNNMQPPAPGRSGRDPIQP